MTDPSAQQGPYNLQEGLRLFQHGENEAALKHLSFFTNLKPITAEVVIAMHHSGVACRRMGYFDASVRHLGDAMKYALQFPSFGIDTKAIREDQLATSIASEEARRRL